MRRQKVVGVALLVTLALGLAGCGAAAKPLSLGEEPATEVRWAETEPAPVPALAPEQVAEEGMSAALPEMTERMVVRTADLDLIVPDTEKAMDQIEALAEELGGYVVSLNTYQYQEGVEASITFRVPADSFDTAIERVREIATTVRRESISGQDVTEEYVDLEARLRHLQAKEAQLLEFLDQAEDTEAVMQVYEELSRTQEEIERVRGRMQYLENQTAMATITVSLIPDELAQPLEVRGWNLPGTIRNAVELLLDVLEFTIKSLIYLTIVGLPTVLVIAAFVYALVSLGRWTFRRLRKPKA